MGETIPFDGGQRPAKAPRDDDAPIRETHGGGLQQREYGNEEVSEIIRVALKNAGSGKENQVNHAEMLSIAGEFGLTEADLARAHDTIVQGREKEGFARQAMLSFRVHLMLFVAVNFGLFIINMLSSPGVLWFLYPVASWGTIVAVHGILAKYLPQGALMMFGDWIGLSKDLGGPKRDHLGNAARAPFTIPELFGGMARAKGIAQIDGDELLLEYEITDNMIHAIKSKVKEVRIPLAEIESIRLERRLVWTCLRLRGRRLLSFSKVPGSESGEASLIFSRSNRAESERLARDLEERIAH